MCEKCRRDCKSCKTLIKDYGEENLEVCEFCGHYYVQNIDETGFCTCTKGEQKEYIKKGMEIHNKIQELSKLIKIESGKVYTEQEIDKLLFEYNDYVLCMKCQKSFHMDDCQPIINSEYGYVYCKECYNKMETFFIQIETYAELLRNEYPDIETRIAIVDKNSNIIKIFSKNK